MEPSKRKFTVLTSQKQDTELEVSLSLQVLLRIKGEYILIPSDYNK